MIYLPRGATWLCTGLRQALGGKSQTAHLRTHVISLQSIPSQTAHLHTHVISLQPIPSQTAHLHAHVISLQPIRSWGSWPCYRPSAADVDQMKWGKPPCQPGRCRWDRRGGKRGLPFFSPTTLLISLALTLYMLSSCGCLLAQMLPPRSVEQVTSRFEVLLMYTPILDTR